MEAQDKAVALLQSKLNTTLPETTLYLLSKDMYLETYASKNPEWTQGFAQGANVYVNRAPVRVWDASIPAEERIQWLGEHVQEITQRTTAHELTHAALSHLKLPRWLDEGLAEYIESLVAPGSSAARQTLQRRYTVREAFQRNTQPSAAKLATEDWMTNAANEQEFGLLYDTSALVVQTIAGASGDAGLRALMERRGPDVPLDTFINSPLKERLSSFLTEERAGLVACGLNRSLGQRSKLITDWNVALEVASSDWATLKGRVQEILTYIQALPQVDLTEQARLGYTNSYTEWVTAIDFYMRNDTSLGSLHIDLSNRQAQEAYQLFVEAWNSYAIVPCATIEAQVR